MKVRMFIIILVCLSLFTSNSCEKQSDKDEGNAIPKEIIGRWEWLLTYEIYPIKPLTPQNTGIQEILELKENKKWLLIQNNSYIDSGTFSAGHGIYTPCPGAYTYVYDSIAFYSVCTGYLAIDFYKIYTDTIIFCNCFAGIYGGGSKHYKKLKTLR